MPNATKAFKSLDQMLKSEGWEVEKLVLTGDLSEALVKIAIEYASGKYDDLKLIPSDIARDGADWIPVHKSHILYVKRSKAYKEKLKENGESVLIATMCRYRDTNQEQPVPISGKNQ